MAAFPQGSRGSEFGDLISQKIASEEETFYHHYDGLGSTAVLTDALGVATDEYDYEAFGKTAAESGPTPNPYKWVGRLGYRYDEETDLYDVRRRKYAPDAGRFLSEDPVRDQEENLYRYVGNDPVGEVDPSGEVRIRCECGKYVARGYSYAGGMNFEYVKSWVYTATPAGWTVEELCNKQCGSRESRFTGKWEREGQLPDSSAEETFAREKAERERRLQEELLAQATEDVMNARVRPDQSAVQIQPGFQLQADGSVRDLNRSAADLACLQSQMDSGMCRTVHVRNENGRLEDTAEGAITLSETEFKRLVASRYQELLNENKWKNDGRLAAIQYTIDILAFTLAFVPGAQPLAVLLELTNAGISAKEGNFTEAGLRLIGTGSGYLIGKSIQRSLQGSKKVNVLKEGADEAPHPCPPKEEGTVLVKTEGAPTGCPDNLGDPKIVLRYPDDPDDLTKILGVDPKISTTQHDTRRYLWEPNSHTRIRFESHPQDPGTFNPRHHGEHYHVEIKPWHLSWNQAKKQGCIIKVKPEGYSPGHGTGFLPGEPFPGQ